MARRLAAGLARAGGDYVARRGYQGEAPWPFAGRNLCIVKELRWRWHGDERRNLAARWLTEPRPGGSGDGKRHLLPRVARQKGA